MASLTLFGGICTLFLIGAALIYARLIPSRYTGLSRPLPSAKQQTSAPAVSVTIVVLGDIGHSPRMQYHAQSIAKHGGRVNIVGYLVSQPNLELLTNPLVSIIPLPVFPIPSRSDNKLIFPLLAIAKVLHQIWCLWFAVAYQTEATQWMLVQNPPSIPTLIVAQFTCWLRNTRLIIDWHNFGYSILGMKLGQNHPMVKVMRHHEMAFGRYATAHFAVSNAMAKVLQEELKIRRPILVLHDRPPMLFQPISSEGERLEFLSTLPETAEFIHALKSGKKCELVVSSTSWTPDEDFSVLLDALCRYSTFATTVKPQLPELHVIITGKGPQQQLYLNKISILRAQGKLEKISLQSAWLSIQNYAKLLACSSLGVCLHTSSSGVDLPMKVVDMFGAGLPVVGWDNYEAWPELVTEDMNGRGFNSAEGLTNHLVNLFGESRSCLETLRQGARHESTRRWSDEWDPVAGRLLGLVA